MSRMIDTANIRAGARNFSAAAHELHGNAKRLDQVYQNLSSGQYGWKGEGAEAFQTVNNQMRDDCYAAANAFERTSSVLNTLAGMFDQVNHLRQQADYFDRQIDSLESQLWSAEETRKASLRSEITQLRHRKSSLEHDADQLEYRAHAAASSQFHQIEAMANRLHYGPAGSAHAEEGGLFEKAKKFLGGLWDSAKEAADEIGDKVEEFGEFLEAKAGEVEHFVEEKMDEWLDDEFEYYARIAWGNFGDFAEGAVCAYVNNMTFGLFEEQLLDDEGQTSAYYLGRIVGDAAAAGTGAEMVNVGAGAVAGGLGEAAISASGVVSAPLAVPGLAVAAAGGVAAAYGAGVSAKAVESGVKDWQLFQKSLGEGELRAKPIQNHHYATNKNKKYTPQMEEITKKYGLDLDDDWNKDLLPHQGRHPEKYHKYILGRLDSFDKIARGDKEKFLKLYEQLKQEVREKPEMLYKEYWRDK